MKVRSQLLILLLAVPAIGAEPMTLKARVYGLFMPNREADLREVLKQWPEVELVHVDFATSEAEFKIDADKLFPKVKPTDVLNQLDNKLRSATLSTFGLKPLSTVPRDQLQKVEIPVVGLDCKACSFACYEIVARLEGVEQATASFKDGRVTALIDPKRTDKSKLEAALKQRNVVVK